MGTEQIEKEYGTNMERYLTDSEQLKNRNGNACGTATERVSLSVLC